MKNLNLLPKKSLLFVLLVLLVGSQGLVAMDSRDDSSGKQSYSSVWFYINPFACMRYFLGTGEYAVKDIKKNSSDKEKIGFKKTIEKLKKMATNQDDTIKALKEMVVALKNKHSGEINFLKKEILRLERKLSKPTQ